MNSKWSRVAPIFGWLCENGGPNWPSELLALCDNLHLPVGPGSSRNGHGPRGRKKRVPSPTFQSGEVLQVDLEKERRVKARPERLAWMIRNAHRLAPSNPKKSREIAKRVIDNPDRDDALQILDGGTRKGVPKKLILEGPTYADCLLECENLIIWIEGKRRDCLATATKWDLCRDQLARNLEAVWHLASEAGKEYCLLLCHEGPLKHHEEALVAGYRACTWSAGMPHLPPEVRRKLGQRLGTLPWARILAYWPELSELPALEDVVVAGC